LENVVAPKKFCKYIYIGVFFLCNFRVQCSLSKAVVELNHLPERMNPVVRPLMDCMKKEENIDLQVCICSSLK
jgi:TATA-binding protein-associated factor